MLKIPDLSFEIEGDFINLEQDAGCGEVDRLTMHRSQVALLASEMGVVRAPHDGEAQRTIAKLERRLRVLRDRIDMLDEFLCNNSDHRHADLSYEVAFSSGTVDIADEFCADLDEGVTPCHATSQTERDTVSAPDADKLRTPSGQAMEQLF